MRKQAVLLILVFIFIFFGVIGVTYASNESSETNLSTSQISSNNSNISSIENQSNSTEYNKNQIFVRFKSDNGNMPEISANAHSMIGATLIKEFNEVNGLQLVQIPENMTVTDAIALYLKNQNVLYAEPDYVYKDELIPNDPAYTSYLWGLSRINAPAAWNIATGSSNVIIAIVDTGIDLNHPDLKNNIWINIVELHGLPGVDDDRNGYIDDIYGWDFANNDNNPSDDNGHGTHVAGIIAAVGNNLAGVTGVMWNATIMPLKFLDSTGQDSIYNAISAISYASKMGAHIINNSWGEYLFPGIEGCNRRLFGPCNLCCRKQRYW